MIDRCCSCLVRKWWLEFFVCCCWRRKRWVFKRCACCFIDTNDEASCGSFKTASVTLAASNMEECSCNDAAHNCPSFPEAAFSFTSCVVSPFSTCMNSPKRIGQRNEERRRKKEGCWTWNALSIKGGGAEKNGLIKCRIPNVRLRDN